MKKKSLYFLALITIVFLGYKTLGCMHAYYTCEKKNFLNQPLGQYGEVLTDGSTDPATETKQKADYYYHVLGALKTDKIEDITGKFKKLSDKYSQDKFKGNQLNELDSRKFTKQLEKAYDMIVKAKREKPTYYGLDEGNSAYYKAEIGSLQLDIDKATWVPGPNAEIFYESPITRIEFGVDIYDIDAETIINFEHLKGTLDAALISKGQQQPPDIANVDTKIKKIQTSYLNINLKKLKIGLVGLKGKLSLLRKKLDELKNKISI